MRKVSWARGRSFSIPAIRSLRLESLEDRCMLSHPTVAAVNLSGTNWSEAFISHLESYNFGVDGYAIPVGGSDQLKSLPWTNLNQIHITFDQNVDIQASDLSVSGVNTTCYAFSAFNYNSSTYTATWTLASDLTKDKIFLDLDGDGLDPVASAATQEVLDGAWTDCSSVYNSGNGSGGTDFQFRFNVLPGDAVASNSINITDSYSVYRAIGAVPGDAAYNIRYDIDGSGTIVTSDYNLVTQRYNNLLPTANPVGMTNDAPTTSGLAKISQTVNASNYVLALTSYFDDAETAADDLAYSVVGNSNSSLFDSLTFDSSGNLTFDFAANTTGDALLTLRATDQAGLFVSTTVEVSLSAAPEITSFYCYKQNGNQWVIGGTVTDSDDATAGDIVTFGGALEGYHLTAVVDEFGDFCINPTLVGLVSGNVTAQTSDSHGVLSEEASMYVYV